MQWMADGIHGFTVTDHQKNPLEELIVSWIAHALSEICQEMIVSTFSKCIQNIIFNACFVKHHPLFSAFFSLSAVKK